MRGNALPETALVISVVLLVFFGAAQMALAAYTQVNADGAAFIAAHDTVMKYGAPDNKSDPTVVTYARTAARTVFPTIGATSSDLTASNPDNASFEVTVTKSTPGFTFFSIGAPTFAITSRAIEAQAPIGPIRTTLLDFSSPPKLPGSPRCGALTETGATGQSMIDGATTMATQAATMGGVLTDLNALLIPMNALLAPGSSGNVVTAAIAQALGTGTLGTTSAITLLAPVNAAIGDALQPAITAALDSGTPTSTSALTSALGTALYERLGAVAPLLGPIVPALTTLLSQSVITPLTPPINKLATDSGAIATIVGGAPCS